MSLADEWDAIPASGTAQPKTMSVADEWEALPTTIPSQTVSTKPRQPITSEQVKQRLSEMGQKYTTTSGIPTAIAETAAQQASGLGASIIGGWRALATLASGGSVEDAANAANQEIANRTYQPQTQQGQVLSNVANLPGQAVGYVAEKGGEATLKATGSPAAAAGVTTAITALPALLLRKGGKATPTESESELPPQYYQKPITQATPETVPTNIPAEKVSTVPPEPIDLGISVPEAGTKQAAIESPPVEKGLPLDVQQERAAVLQRIGLDQVHQHAITGNALEGATNAQLARFDEPAGQAAKAQFATEYNALKNHANSIVQDTGGTVGLDEDTVHARGQTIAAPFDALAGWFDKATNKLYQEAEQRSQGMPVVSTDPIESLLNDRTFKNSAMAQDKTNLVNAIGNQLDLFKENNPQGLTVADAENFKKWLNQQWSNDNKHIIGQVKDAVDDSVMKSAGEDVFAQARQMYQLKKQTLENPKGINRLMETDPNTPINRTTPFEKVPDTISRMSVDQYRNVIDTLKGMPEELQPQAQAALSEIKAHFANKLADAGQPKTKVESVFWNNKNVNKFLSDNKAKIASTFSPEEIQKINDLRAAGNILTVDASYPGAAAQAANALKQGVGARLITPAMATITGGIGSIFGPTGAGAGTYIGKAAGEKLAATAGEKAALAKYGKRVVRLSDIGK